MFEPRSPSHILRFLLSYFLLTTDVFGIPDWLLPIVDKDYGAKIPKLKIIINNFVDLMHF